MNDLRNIDIDLPKIRDENLTNISLYGNKTYDDETNQIILMHAVRYIKDSQRFYESLFNRPKLIMLTYTFDSASNFNTHKM